MSDNLTVTVNGSEVPFTRRLGGFGEGMLVLDRPLVGGDDVRVYSHERVGELEWVRFPYGESMGNLRLPIEAHPAVR